MPFEFELGPAVQFGGPTPNLIYVGGRAAWFARLHQYFSWGVDLTSVRSVDKRTLYGAPIQGMQFGAASRICTHVSFAFFCAGASYSGSLVATGDNVFTSAFPNNWFFMPLIGVGATWKISPWFALRANLDGAILADAPDIRIDLRDDQIYHPFPVLGTFSTSFVFSLPTWVEPGKEPK
jgi:hypothetical protein